MDAKSNDLPDTWSEEMPWLGEYVLDEQGNPQPATGLLQWAEWMETAHRQIALTEFAGGRVSTIFLGLDVNFLFGPESDPLHYRPVLWETMIFLHPADADLSVGAPVFGGSLDLEQRRYTTREEALEGHREMVERARKAGNQVNGLLHPFTALSSLFHRFLFAASLLHFFAGR